MAWPYDLYEQQPELDPGFGMPEAPKPAPPPAGPTDKELLELMLQRPPDPTDFWGKLAMSAGPQPFHFQSRQKPRGIDVILSGLAGFGNVKAGQAAAKIGREQQKAADVRQAASTLATFRHQERMRKDLAEQNRLNREASLAANRHLVTEKDVAEAPELKPLLGKAITQSTYERYMAGPTAAEKRAAEAADLAGRRTQGGLIASLEDDVRQNQAIQSFIGLQQNLGTARNAARLATGWGDVAMLIAFYRATEPGKLSVVRQEEFRNAESAMGELRRAFNTPARWFQGSRLTPTARGELVKSIETITAPLESRARAAIERYRNRGIASGIDPSLYLPSDAEMIGETDPERFSRSTVKEAQMPNAFPGYRP